MSASNCVTSSPSAASRSTSSAAGAHGRRQRRSRRRRVGCSPDLDPLGERAQVGRGVGARPQPVALEDRRDHPHGRGLAVGAHHVDRGEAALGHAEHGHEPVHAVEPEPHAEQLEPQQVVLGLPASVMRPASSARSALELVALGLHDLGGRLLDEAVVGQLALGAGYLLLELFREAPAMRLLVLAAEIRSEASTCDGAAVNGDRRNRLLVRRSRRTRTGTAGDLVLQRRPGRQPRPRSFAPRRHARLVAIAAQRRDGLDRRAMTSSASSSTWASVDLGPRRGGQQAAVARHGGPDLLGDERHDRVQQHQDRSSAQSSVADTDERSLSSS